MKIFKVSVELEGSELKLEGSHGFSEAYALACGYTDKELASFALENLALKIRKETIEEVQNEIK